MAGGTSSSAEKNDAFVQHEIEYLKHRKTHSSATATIFKADNIKSTVKAKNTESTVIPLDLHLGLFREDEYKIEEENPLKTDVLLAFLSDMANLKEGGEREDQGAGKAPDNWKDIRTAVVDRKIVNDMKLRYETPDERSSCKLIEDPEAIQSVLALDAIFITCFIYCVCYPERKKEYLKETYERLYRVNDSRKGQVYHAIFKIEHQIPLDLIRNVVRCIILRFGKRPKSEVILKKSIREETDQMCFGLIKTYEKRFPSCGRVRTDLQGDHLLNCIAEDFRSRSAVPPPSCWTRMRQMVQSCWAKMKGCGRGDNNDSNRECLLGSENREQNSESTSAENQEQEGDIESQKRDSGREMPDDPGLQPYEEKTQIPTANELHKWGINFKGQEEHGAGGEGVQKAVDFLPTFKKHTFRPWRATLFLPKISYIGDDTKQCWVNLHDWEYKYEHFSLAKRKENIKNEEGKRKMPFSQYLWFMKNLVNTEDDVKLLLKDKEKPVITVANLGNHKQVAELFNSTTTTIFTRYDNDWTHLAANINNFHTSPWRRTWVWFVDEYFHTPVLAATSIAAVLLFISGAITSIQGIQKLFQ